MKHHELTGEYIGDVVLTDANGPQNVPELSQVQQFPTPQLARSIAHGKQEQQAGKWLLRMKIDVLLCQVQRARADHNRMLCLAGRQTHPSE